MPRDKNRIGVHGTDEETNRLTRAEFAALGELKDAPKVPALSRAEFTRDAKAIVLDVQGTPVVLNVTQFKTGSMGWHGSAKFKLKVGDVYLDVSANLLLTVINSKNLPQAGESEKT